MSSLKLELSRIYLVRGIVNIPLSVLTTVSNAMVLYLFWKDPKKTIRSSPTNKIVASLAAVDFLVGSFLQPVAAFWFLDASLNDIPPFQSRHLQTIEAFLLLVSTTSVVAISLDRYIAVTTPILYNTRMTKRRVHIGVTCIWLYCIVLITSLQFLGKLYARNIIYCIHLDVALIMTIVMFWLVVHNLRVEAAALHKMDSSNRVVGIALKRQWKVTKTLSVVLGLFLLCCLPWVTMMQVYPFCKRCQENKITFTWIFKMFFVLFQANCALNPFLGAFRLPRFRRALSLFITSIRQNLFTHWPGASHRPSNMKGDQNTRNQGRSLPTNRHHT